MEHNHNDQIAGCGLTFKYHLDKEVQISLLAQIQREI